MIGQSMPREDINWKKKKKKKKKETKDAGN